MLALYAPAVTGFNVSFYTETIYIFLFITGIICLFRSIKAPSVYSLYCGAAWGLACLTRPNAMAFIPVICAWYIICLKIEGIRRIVYFLSVFILCLLPTVLGGLMKYNRLILVTSIGGGGLYVSNIPRITVSNKYDYFSSLGNAMLNMRGREEKIWLNEPFREEVIAAVKQDPEYYIKQFFAKMYWWWRPVNLTKLRGYVDFRGYGLIYPFVFLLFLAGLPGAWRANRRAMLFILMLLGVGTLLAGIYIPLTRYRLPLEYLLIPVVGWIIAWPLRKVERGKSEVIILRKHSARRLIGAAVLGFLIGVLFSIRITAVSLEFNRRRSLSQPIIKKYTLEQSFSFRQYINSRSALLNINGWHFLDWESQYEGQEFHWYGTIMAHTDKEILILIDGKDINAPGEEIIKLKREQLKGKPLIGAGIVLNGFIEDGLPKIKSGSVF